MEQEACPPVVGVAGLGSVGEPLLRMLHSSGYEVIGIDSDLDVLARVKERLEAAGSAGHEARPADDITLSNDVALLGRADVVVEAAPENLAVKKRLLREIDAVCKPSTVVVTTTSSLPLIHLAVVSGRSARTLGLRLLAPPRPGGSVEVVRTAMSSAVAVRALDELLTGLGLEQTTFGAAPATDANELVYAFLNRAVTLLDLGYADQDSIDTALRLGCGLPAGPFEMLDRIGWETVRSSLQELHARTGNEAFRPAALLEKSAGAASGGRAIGRGFHSYDELGARIVPAPRNGDGDDDGLNGVRHIKRVGVLGSGIMACGIAEVAVTAGLPTMLVARSRAKADRAREVVAESLGRAVRKGRTSPAQKDAALGLLQSEQDLAAFGDCDLVIEAVAEETGLKRSVFTRLGQMCPQRALLATTTSSLSVADCASSSGRASQVLGLHFFNPAPMMKLVELVRTPATSEQTLAAARALCARLNKTAIVCHDRAGFIVNYLLFPYLADAIRLLDRPHADIEEIDAAVERGHGFPMGPFRLLDAIGLDVSLAIMKRLHEEFVTPDFAAPPLLQNLVADGCLGRKSGQGFRTVVPR
ncbi:3-hydroxyacyl-CoA dehydrogenase family protein [Streptomyces coffeae]|uniref:3-hydroxyacyl-CoA dehydrogenase family protein n=1 Tax=Streptomyces coffeae TaxID=621382 RepID=A0ABS1NRM1_9ACTN|nr:3-hydroxyacyl-CoA dehydrogenase family protein [Streptomyces coffeae]MBL1102475.1 3-hydroxyacyl-CoA dehydrogenase family protein [Streptomyces coffeae]